jgi:hypothetical protein
MTQDSTSAAPARHASQPAVDVAHQLRERRGQRWPTRDNDDI